MTATATRTTISQAAARLATTVAPKGEAEHILGCVLVEDEAVAASDSKRLLVVLEPHSDGLFSERDRVALVPCDALRDAQRDADRIEVEPDQCTSRDEHGVSLRLVPFAAGMLRNWPDWREQLPGHASTVAKVNPAHIADVLKLLATLGCTSVSIGTVGADSVVLDAELPNEQAVRLLVRHRDAADQTLPGMPEFTKAAKDDDATQALEFEQEGDTAREGGIESVTFANDKESVTIDRKSVGRLRQASRGARSRMPRNKVAARAAKKVLAKGRRTRK